MYFAADIYKQQNHEKSANFRGFVLCTAEHQATTAMI
jgi:hypothetical protein